MVLRSVSFAVRAVSRSRSFAVPHDRGKVIIEQKTYYRRRLPHIQPPESTFFITFRLANSLPKQVVIQLMEEREQREKLIKAEKDIRKQKVLLEVERQRYFGHFDEYLERVKESPRWLAETEVAEMVAESIRHLDGKQYGLHAFCIMSNHVHMLIEIKHVNIALYRVLQKLKSYTAIRANNILHRHGAFWHHESYDHFVRDENELERILWYILENPVKAGLCESWKDWKWSYVSPDLYGDA
jgi:putative transposase